MENNIDLAKQIAITQIFKSGDIYIAIYCICTESFKVGMNEWVFLPCLFSILDIMETVSSLIWKYEDL